MMTPTARAAIAASETTSRVVRAVSATTDGRSAGGPGGGSGVQLWRQWGQRTEWPVCSDGMRARP